MALLAGGCNSDMIQPAGRWRDNTMMEHLHELANLMFNNGNHSFLPS